MRVLKKLKWIQEHRTHTTVTVLGKFSIVRVGTGMYAIADWPTCLVKWINASARYTSIDTAVAAVHTAYEQTLNDLYE